MWSRKTFSIDDIAIVLIDHQIGTFGCVHSIDTDLFKLKKNVKILATFTAKMNMPLALTSSMYVRTEFLARDLCIHVPDVAVRNLPLK